MKHIINEFKEFIMRGNVLDLAVGVIIGGAFQKIIASLVNDVIMPVITLCTGGIDFTNWFIAGCSSCQGCDTELRNLSHRGDQLHHHGVYYLHDGEDDEFTLKKGQEAAGYGRCCSSYKGVSVLQKRDFC